MKKEILPCRKCGAEYTKQSLKDNLYVCPDCGYCHRINIQERLEITVDKDSFKEFGESLQSLNPLSFAGYEDKIESAQKKAENKDAVSTGIAKIKGKDVVIGIMSFHFMGGSMGSVVGEKITRAIRLGMERKLPVILFTASGGARMQEGIFSLMQMAKTAHAAALLESRNVPLFIVLTDPTTGGVTASFAMLGDVTLAEPEALIGFAGARVIEGTIKEKLPEGFQRAAFQQEKGFVDHIVPREEMRDTLAFLIDTH